MVRPPRAETGAMTMKPPARSRVDHRNLQWNCTRCSGYVLAFILVLGSYYLIVLPIWVFAISISMLTDEFS
jgi:hypothetical protein